MKPDDPRHGTLSGYKYLGCRCQPCRASSMRYEKGRLWLIHQGLLPTLPAHGFIRRVHALMAIGWTQKQIAQELGIVPGNLQQKLRANETVRRATHEAMLDIYDRLSMKPQRSPIADRTARIAAKRGWPPPLAWDDIDDPDEQPTDWSYETASRANLLRDCDADRMGVSEVCRRLNLTRAALQKWCGNHDMSDVYRSLAAREDGMGDQNGAAA